MTTPDVRVRLTAEGVQEVVDALKRIQAEAQRASAAAGKASSQGERALGGFRKALSGLTGMLGVFGVAISGAALADLGRRAVESAEAIGKLRERFGGTIEDFSALAVGARLTDASVESLEAALATLVRRVADLRAGNAATAESMARLGLTARSFKGKDAAQQLEVVAHALRQIKNDGDRAAETQNQLGKGARELIPMLEDLGKSGLEGMRAQARARGLLLNAATVQAARKLNDAMGEMNLQMLAAAQQFLLGFGPDAVQIMKEFTQSVGGAASQAKALGQVVGGVARGIYAVFKTVAALLSGVLASVFVRLQGLWAASGAALTGNFRRAIYELSLIEQKEQAVISRMWKDIGAAMKEGFSAAPALPDVNRNAADQQQELQDAFDRRADVMRAALENERRIVEAQIALREKAEDRDYERSRTSISDHYARRRRLVQEALAWETAALVKQRAFALANPDRAAGLREARNLESQITTRKIQAQASLAELADREIADARKLADQRLSYEQKILDAQGFRFASTARRLEEEKRQYADVLRLQGLSTEEISRRVGEFDRAMTAAAFFEEARNEADTVMARFTSERARIQSDVTAGVLTQLQGENAVLALERQRLPGLQEMADALTRAAEATGDPERIAQAQQFSDGLRNMGRAANVAEQAMQHLRAGFEDALRGGLEEFFTSGINQATSFAGAMQSMAASVVNSLQRIAGEALALQIMGFLGFASGGSVRKNNPRAAGGFITGAGTATSDSIPAWLSHGEYVVRAAAVAAPGMLAHLEAINRGMQPVHVAPFRPTLHFADGGLVAGAALEGGAGGSSSLTVALEQGLVLREIKSPEGQRVLVESLARNRRAAGRVLGG